MWVFVLLVLGCGLLLDLGLFRFVVLLPVAWFVVLIMCWACGGLRLLLFVWLVVLDTFSFVIYRHLICYFDLDFSWFLRVVFCYLLVYLCCLFSLLWLLGFVLFVCFALFASVCWLLDLAYGYTLLVWLLWFVYCCWLDGFMIGYLFVVCYLCYFVVGSFAGWFWHLLYVCVAVLSCFIVILFDLLVGCWVYLFGYCLLLLAVDLFCFDCVDCCMLRIRIDLYDFNSNFAFHYYEFEYY